MLLASEHVFWVTNASRSGEAGAELGARGDERKSWGGKAIYKHTHENTREAQVKTHRRHRSQHWGEPLLRVRRAAFRFGRAGKKALINEGVVPKTCLTCRETRFPRYEAGITS